jgi:zinc protease
MSTRFRLGNGLTVVLHPQHTAPVVAFQVWVKAGSGDETPEEVGLAHLHEHMLFKGTRRRGLGEIARSVEAHGGEINAWTSFDQTVYHVVMASRHARHGLDVLADAVRESSFDAGELVREIEVVCEEIKRSLDMPSRRASKAFFAAAFRTHPYGRPVIGFEDAVRAHTRERVLGFYRKHYRPGNMVLSAVGDFDEEEARAWAEESFGGNWPDAPASPTFTRPAEPPFEGIRVSLTEDDVKEAWLHVGFQIPGVDHPDTAALDVLAMLVGQGEASRLSLEVKQKRGLAKDVNTWAWTPKDPGLFAASLVAAPETLAEAFDVTARVLASMTAVEAEPDEVETVKALIEAEAVYQRETVQGLARKLGYYEAVAGGLEREAAYYEAVAQVTPAKLREVARRYFTFDRAVVSGLLPRGTPLSDAQVRELLARAGTERPAPLPPRRLPAPSALRLTSSPRAAKPGLTVERLPSGATVVVREERAAPLFALRAAWPGGLRYETDADNGLTALVARMLTRGTATMDAEQVSHLVDRLAGSLSATAGRSSMGLRGEFLSKHFEAAFDLFAEVATRPAFPPADFAREQKLQLQDIAAREDRPSSVAFELFHQTLYRAHPYRLALQGERTSVEALTPAALASYHRLFMDPSQMVLAVVGDVDTDAVLQRARAAFGARGDGVAAPPSIPVEPAWDGPRVARRVLAKAQTHLVLGFPGARVTDDWRRPLEVLKTLLSGQSGRLFLELRDRRSMAYSVSALVMEGVDPGYFALYMGTSPEKVDAALAGMRTELERLREELVSPAELERAKEHLIGTHDIGLQRNAARAAVIALDTCYGLGPGADAHYAEAIAAVTAEDVRAVAQRVIDFSRSALAIVGP